MIPLLMRRAEVLRLTGWSLRKYQDLKKLCPDMFVRPPGYRQTMVLRSVLLKSIKADRA